MSSRKTALTKSAFIRSQPTALSAAEVVAKGSAEGMKIRPGLVYEVRRTAKTRKRKSTKTTTTPSTSAARSTSSARKPSTQTKADFVRGRSHLSPKEIVEDAKASGLQLDIAYVYKVRGTNKRAGQEMRTATRRSTARKAMPVARPISTTSKAEELLRAVAAEVGLGRAIELLEGERARVHAILRA